MSRNHQYDSPHHYDSPYSPPPQLPEHQTFSKEEISHYPMENIAVSTTNSLPPYQDNGSPPPLPRASMSDTRFINRYDSDDDMEGAIIPREKKRRSCIDKTCCGCCTCCPKWLRWCTCIIFIIILIIAIVIGVLAALFKVPNVSFDNSPATPVVSHPSSSALNISSSIGISVDNQNFESLTFSYIKAEAYYPSPYNLYVGGGQVDNIHISSNAVTNFTFPFSLEVDSNNAQQQGVLMDLLTKCGLDGSTAEKIKLNLKIYPSVKIIGIPITLTISKSIDFDCPITSGDLSTIFGSG
ncbi:hypothetical protein K501DRAFT_336535 [Backusella circina FSU 941]|nr:hypothetical protein K501DRAFT_336535 [Backusella circina FSU 941]